MGEGRNSGDLSRFTEGTWGLVSCTSGIPVEWKQKFRLQADGRREEAATAVSGNYGEGAEGEDGKAALVNWKDPRPEPRSAGRARIAEEEGDSRWISAPGEGQRSCLPGATAPRPAPSDAGTFREGPDTRVSVAASPKHKPH